MIDVLFMIPNLGHGGAEKVLVNLVTHMDRKKFNITVMCLYDEGVNKASLPDDIEYIGCMKKSFPGVSHVLKLFSPERLYKHFVKKEYDVVVSYLEGQTARIVSGCKSKSTKLISWIHVEQHTAKNAARTFRNIKEMKRCYMKFDRTVCVSEYVKNDFCSIVPVKNATVLYNTIESDRIRTLADETLDNIILSEEKIKLCGVGTLKKSKGFDRLLRIHLQLIQDGYPIHTYILGEGPEEKNLEDFVSNNHISDSVTFLGYHTNPYKFLKKCDLFVCTSFAEGFSTAATEALIVGTPVCTVEVSGMKEMLGENNEFGIVTENSEEDLYQGIKTLLEDRNLYSHYKKQTLCRGEMFETKSTVVATENMLIACVNK